MSTPHTTDGPYVVIISGGVSQPSATRLLADRTASKLVEALEAAGTRPRTSAVELAPLASDVVASLLGGVSSSALQTAMSTIAEADVLVVSTPVYKAGISGLVKSFFDAADDDLVVGKVVILAGTAGSPRHAMVVDDHLRPLLAFMRTVTAPTAIFASPEDWADVALTRRMERAAVEAVALWRSDVEKHMAQSSWDSYHHPFGSKARHSPDAEGLDFDTPLMRLAAGGR